LEILLAKGTIALQNSGVYSKTSTNGIKSNKKGSGFVATALPLSYSVNVKIIFGGFQMKIVVMRSPKLLSGILKKLFGIQKTHQKR
jgi:hypothetical protein